MSLIIKISNAFKTVAQDIKALKIKTTPNTVSGLVLEVLGDYSYAGCLVNGSPIIERHKDGKTEVAQGVTALTTDWANKTTLTYA